MRPLQDTLGPIVPIRCDRSALPEATRPDTHLARGQDTIRVKRVFECLDKPAIGMVIEIEQLRCLIWTNGQCVSLIEQELQGNAGQNLPMWLICDLYFEKPLFLPSSNNPLNTFSMACRNFGFVLSKHNMQTNTACRFDMK